MASGNAQILKLFEFCKTGDRIGLANFVITNKCNPSAYDARDSNGQTALHIACQHGHLFVVRSLIEIFGCSPLVRDASGNLPVHYACQHGHLPMVDYLLHFKDVLSITQAVFEVDSEGSNLLHKACQSGSAPVVRYLQEILCYNSKILVPRKLNLYYDSIAPYSTPSLPEKASFYHPFVLITALLTKNHRGDSPLHVACRHGHSAIVKLFKFYLPLLKQFNLALTATRCNHINLANYIRCVSMNKVFVGIDSESLIEIEGGKLFFLSSLLGEHARNCYYMLYLKCLHCKKYYYFAMHAPTECEDCNASLSIFSSATSHNINAISERKERQDFKVAFSPPYTSCLQGSALSGNLEVFKNIKGKINVQCAALAPASKIPVRLLAAAYARKMVEERHYLPYDSGTLHAACVSDNVELVRHIMETLNCEPNVLDPEGNTLLHIACEWGSHNVFKLLIQLKDLKKDVVNKAQTTPLSLACKYGRYDFFEPLLNCYSIVSKQETPLHIVSASNHVTVEVLAKFVNSSVINSVDQHGDTPIFNACRSGNLDAVQYLIEKGSDPCFVNQFTKETPVHIACRMARHDILKVLLAKSIARNFEANCYTSSPIQLAIESGCEETLLVLIKSYDSEVLNSVLNDRQQTLAHFVCIVNNIKTAEYLIKQNVNWNVQDKNGNTPLHLASYYDCTEIAKRIVPYCLITIQNNILWTPFHITSRYGYVEFLHILLEQKINYDNLILDDLVDKDGNTPLHLACEAISHFPCDVAQQLFPHCSRVVRNKANEAPLHIACRSGNLALVKLLLNESNTDDVHLIVDNNLNTILHVAVENTSSLEVVAVVVDVVQPVHKNSQSETPIHIACRNGDLDIVRLLITKAAELIFTDSGDSYLHSACLGKSLEVVEYLTEKSELDFANLMCQNSAENTPLHIACITGDHDVVCYLMKHGSKYAQTLNKEGRTPFSCLLSSGHHTTAEYILSSEEFDKTKLAEAENPLLHCVIKYLDDPKMVFKFVMHLVRNKISDPLVCDSKGNTILHSFLLKILTWGSQLFIENIERHATEVWTFLLDVPRIQLCAQNKDGDTPLHIFVQLSHKPFSYYDSILETYLKRTLSDCVDLVNFKNQSGKTAIQLASRKETQLLIKYGANPEDVSELYGEILARSKKNCPLKFSTKIVVLGNSEAGKSTLVEAIKRFEIPPSEQSQLVQSTGSTAGINTISYDSKVLGHVTFHDFGGQPQFESANAVFLKNKVSLDYPPLFLVVADISQPHFVKQIQYWFCYIRNNSPVHLTPHIIIIGSHVDCVLESEYQKVKKSIHFGIKNEKSCKLADVILLNCRKVTSEAGKELNRSLNGSSKQLHCSLELDCRCHVLIAYLSRWYKDDSEVTFKKIQNKISSIRASDNVLPMVALALLDLLKNLHSSGQITLLNPDNIDHCWVVLNDSVLYEKVNGILFAPPDQEFGVPKLPPNSGVITSNMLKCIFNDIDINLITAYIIHSELGQKIEDPETLKLIQSAVAKEPQMDTKFTLNVNISKASKEEYLFIPSCIKNERPSDIWSTGDENSYSFCWYMKCKINQFLNQRFLQVLLLRLTFNFVTEASSQFHRNCNIWMNGIYWSTNKGIEVLVEVIEQNSAVVLLMRFPEGFEMEGVKFRAQVLRKILNTKNEICPKSKTVEILFPRTLKYPIDTQDKSKILMSDLAQELISCDSCIVRDSKSKPHNLSKLLLFEPIVHSMECLWCEEDQSKAVSKEIQEEICKILVKRKITKQVDSDEFLENIKSCTYEALRTLISHYSIFCDRNPFEIALTKPNPEEYQECLFNIKKVDLVSSQETHRAPTQQSNKAIQAENLEHSIDVLPSFQESHDVIAFQKTPSPIDSSTEDFSNKDVTLTVSHVDRIFRILLEAKDKHHFIGCGIGVNEADLKEIEYKYSNTDRCLKEVLLCRVQQGGLTRSRLCHSLRDRLVGRDDIAQEIEALELTNSSNSESTPPAKRPKRNFMTHK